MKMFAVLFFAVSLLLSGCCSVSETGEPQAYDLWLSDGTITMKLLHKLDSGDVAVTKRMMITELLVTLNGLPDFAKQTRPTADQKQQELKLARDLLDYMFKHREDFDPRLLTVWMGVRAMQKMLTEPDDVRRLTELSSYFTAVEKKMSETPKP